MGPKTKTALWLIVLCMASLWYSIRVYQADVLFGNALQKQEAVLRQLLNAPPHGPILIRGGFEETAAIPDADSLFNLARRQRTELAMARDAENAARLQARLSSLGTLPSLRVNLSYGSKNGYIPDLDKMRANWVAAVAAEMPIFDGGRISSQSDEAKAALLAEQAHTQDVERQVRADVEQAEAEVRAAQSKIRITRDQLQQAHEAVVMARSRYETGSATNLDVLDAEAAESAMKESISNTLLLFGVVSFRHAEVK